MSEEDINSIIADAAAEVEITLKIFRERTHALQQTSDELARLLNLLGEENGR